MKGESVHEGNKKNASSVIFFFKTIKKHLCVFLFELDLGSCVKIAGCCFCRLPVSWICQLPADRFNPLGQVHPSCELGHCSLLSPLPSIFPWPMFEVCWASVHVESGGNEE